MQINESHLRFGILGEEEIREDYAWTPAWGVVFHDYITRYAIERVIIVHLTENTFGGRSAHNTFQRSSFSIKSCHPSKVHHNYTQPQLTYGHQHKGEKWDIIICYVAMLNARRLRLDAAFMYLSRDMNFRLMKH